MDDNELLVAYRIANGHPDSIDYIMGWLRNHNLTTHFKWDGGTAVISLNLQDIRTLRALQRAQPSRFGNVEEAKVGKGTPIKSRWGQWYRHDPVTLYGKEIGRIQVRRRYFGKRMGHRMESITLLQGSNACVLGTDVGWLVRLFETPDPILTPDTPQEPVATTQGTSDAIGTTDGGNG